MDGYPLRIIHPLSDTRRAAAAGTAADVLRFGPVPTGKVWKIDNLAVMDEDNAPTSVNAYIWGASELTYLDGVSAPTANIVTAFKGPFWIPEGRELRVYFNGATAADDIHAHMNGIELDNGSPTLGQ